MLLCAIAVQARYSVVMVTVTVSRCGSREVGYGNKHLESQLFPDCNVQCQKSGDTCQNADRVLHSKSPSSSVYVPVDFSFSIGMSNHCTTLRDRAALFPKLDRSLGAIV